MIYNVGLIIKSGRYSSKESYTTYRVKSLDSKIDEDLSFQNIEENFNIVTINDKYDKIIPLTDGWAIVKYSDEIVIENLLTQEISKTFPLKSLIYSFDY